MTRLRHGSLFTGIGGFDLAAEWAGFENVFQVEIDKYCISRLKKNFPNVEQYEDIKEFDGEKYRGTIDVISGGFPCQPFSVAGKRQSQNDDRYLWPEMFRVIKTIKPTFVICENVPGIIKLALDKTLSDLEDTGYTSETFVIPACAKNAWHKRDRVWVIAYTNEYANLRNTRKFSGEEEKESIQKWDNLEYPDLPNSSRSSQVIANRSSIRGNESVKKRQPKFINQDDKEGEINTNYNGFGFKEQCEPISTEKKYITPEHPSWWTSEPGVGRVVHGLPNRVDRIKGLGNAIVPQIALEFFEAINKLVYG